MYCQGYYFFNAKRSHSFGRVAELDFLDMIFVFFAPVLLLKSKEVHGQLLPGCVEGFAGRGCVQLFWHGHTLKIENFVAIVVWLHWRFGLFVEFVL